MKWVNDDYSHNLRIYEKRDARKAIIVYCLILGSAFFQGWLYTTNLNVYVLNLSQIGIPLLITILFLYFFQAYQVVKALNLLHPLYILIVYLNLLLNFLIS